MKKKGKWIENEKERERERGGGREKKIYENTERGRKYRMLKIKNTQFNQETFLLLWALHVTKETKFIMQVAQETQKKIF